MEDNNKLLDSRSPVSWEDFVTGTISEKQYLTHNVVLFVVDIPTSSFVGIPLGFHIRIRLLDGVAPERKYTPVNHSIYAESISTTSGSDISHESSTTIGVKRKVYFIIKLYEDGLLTKHLINMSVTSQLEIGKVAGRLSPSFFSPCDTLAMFAGGSGITPFMRIVDFLLNRSATYPVKRIILVFFNHTEKDIICHDQWTKLSQTVPVFHYFPVISSPIEPWTGLSGRVDSVPLFESILNQTTENGSDKFGKFKAMLCGSSGFNAACVT